MMQGILSPWEKSILEVFRLYIIKIYIYSRMRCILQGILVYFQSLRPSFDTILIFNYWIGNCCKSFIKALNLAKIRTQDHNNAKLYVKNTASPSIISVAWMLCPIEMVKIKKSSFFWILKNSRNFLKKVKDF